MARRSPAWLSRRQLLELTIGLVGAQLLWSIETAYGTPYLESLGLSKEQISRVWLAGPVSGVMMQPIIGALSDASESPFRRRRFIMGGAAFALVSLLLVAWADDVGTAIGARGAPIAAIGFCVLDFAINTLQPSLRALIVDQVVSGDQDEEANAWSGRMMHLANVSGYLLGYLDLGVALAWVGGGQFRKLAVVGGTLVSLVVTVTCATQKEDPNPRVDKGGVSHALRNIGHTVKTLPIPVQRVCYVQFFAWSAWFPFLFYSTTYISDVLFSSLPEGSARPTDEEATRTGSFALLLYALVAAGSSVVLPMVATLAEHPTVRQRWQSKSAKRALCLLTPRNLWTVSLIGITLAMFSTFFVKSTTAAICLVAAMGIPWSVACWVPFALVMEAIRTDPSLSSSGTIDGGHRKKSHATATGGMILGIHNLSTALPQFAVSGVAMLIFRYVPATSSAGSSQIAWLWRFAGCMSAIGAVVSRRLKVPESEKAYCALVWSDESGEDLLLGRSAGRGA